jgi:hypothetical protein
MAQETPKLITAQQQLANEQLIRKSLNLNYEEKKDDEAAEEIVWTWNTVSHTQVLAEALATGFESDVMLYLGKDDEKEEFPAHKFILSIYSPVLQKVIKSSKNGVRILSHIDPVLFKMVLKV